MKGIQSPFEIGLVRWNGARAVRQKCAKCRRRQEMVQLWVGHVAECSVGADLRLHLKAKKAQFTLFRS